MQAQLQPQDKLPEYPTRCEECRTHDLSSVKLAKSTGVSLSCLACTIKKVVCRAGTHEKDDDEVKKADKDVSTPIEDVKPGEMLSTSRLYPPLSSSLEANPSD